MEGNPAALQGATLPRCLSCLRAVAPPPGPRGTAALLSLRVQRYWRFHRGCADRASKKHRSLASQIVSAAAFSLFQKDVVRRYSGLMFAVRITLAHFSVSAARPVGGGRPL